MKVRYWTYDKGSPITTAGLTSLVQLHEFEKGRFRYMDLHKKILKEVVRIKQRI